MRSTLARLGAGSGALLLVLVGVLLAILPSPGSVRARSVFSTTPSGLRALYLLCESLGFQVEPWSKAPGELATPSQAKGGSSQGTLLVLAHLPEAPPALPGVLTEGRSGETPARRSRDLVHYRAFVEQGGTLLLLGARQEEIDFLGEALGWTDFVELEDASLFESPGLARDIVLVGDERLVLAASVRRHLRPREPEVGPPAGTILVRAEDGSALVLARAVGAGRVVLSSLPLDGLDNRALAKDGEPALVFVRVLEGLAPLRRVLFDEYALGGWRPEAASSLAFSSRLAGLSLHVLLILFLLGWRATWSGPFPRDPVPWLAASPLARAQGFGRTLARAGRFDLLTRLLRGGVLGRWEARAGRRSTAADAEELPERLRALAAGDGARLARMEALFLGRAPTSEGELARLDAELRALEGRLFAPGGSERNPSPGGARAPRTASSLQP